MKKLLLAAVPLIALNSCSININGLNPKSGAADELIKERTETIQVKADDIMKIDVELEVGQCTVNYGGSENVDIVGKYECRGLNKDKVSEVFDNIKLKHEVRNNTLYLSFDELKNTSFISRTTDLEITLPKSFCDFDISTDVGDIMLNELCGSFELYADVGNITAENITLNGDSKLEADVGDVDVSLADIAECEFEISSDVGNIDLDTQGIDYTEKDVSKDTVSEKYELVIGKKCQAELSADVGDITIRK